MAALGEVAAEGPQEPDADGGSAAPAAPVPPAPEGEAPDGGVREELLARRLDEQIHARFPVGRRLKVLDAGCGRGGLALRLARAGHEVTGTESRGDALEAACAALSAEPEGIRERVRFLDAAPGEAGRRFGAGSFDVVLCHGALTGPEAEPTGTEALLASLARVLAPGGLLSLLVPNADAPAMRAGLCGDWDGALAALDPDRYGPPGGTEHAAPRREALAGTLRGIGVPLHEWYGVQVFTDRLPDRLPDGDAGPAPEAVRERMLTAEEEAGRRDPYRQVAGLLHLFGVRD